MLVLIRFIFSEGEDWSEFRKLVASDSNLPDREEVLILIDYHKNDVNKRKQLLRKLNRGIAYRYIVRNIFRSCEDRLLRLSEKLRN